MEKDIEQIKPTRTGKSIKTGTVRISFPCLDKPRKPRGRENDPAVDAKYSVVMLFPKTRGRKEEHPVYKLIAAAMKEAAREKGGYADQMIKNAVDDVFQDGDKKLHSETGEPYEGHAGHYAVRASNSKTVDLRNRALENADPSLMYSGSWWQFRVEAYAYNATAVGGKKSLGLSLQTGQFLGHDKPFGSVADASSDFEALKDPSNPDGPGDEDDFDF